MQIIHTVSILNYYLNATYSNSILLLSDSVPLFNCSPMNEAHGLYNAGGEIYSHLFSDRLDLTLQKTPALLERRALCNYKKVHPPFALAPPSVPPFSHLVLSFFFPFLPFLFLSLVLCRFFRTTSTEREQLLEDGKTVRCRNDGRDGRDGRELKGERVAELLALFLLLVICLGNGRAGFLITRLTNERNSLLSNRGRCTRWYPRD